MGFFIQCLKKIIYPFEKICTFAAVDMLSKKLDIFYVMSKLLVKKLMICLLGLLLLNGCSKDESGNDEGEKLKIVTLTFAKLVIDNATVTVADLLAHIKEEEKVGFAIKSLSSSDAGILSITGKAPNYQLTVKKYGEVTLTMVLSKKGYKEVTLKAVLVIKEPAFTFRRLVTAKSSITSQEILSQIDNQTGYKVKGITLKDASFGSVTGTMPNLKITLTKYGIFTADIVLSKAGHLDATIRGATFERTTNILPAPDDLTFVTLRKTYSSGGRFTANEILGNINGTKAGYTLKAIQNLSPSGIASIAADKKSIQFIKAGNFTATLVLTHAAKDEATIKGAQFEISKQEAPTDLSFEKLTRTDKFTVTAVDLLGNLRGTKAGYQLKAVSFADSSYGTVTGTKPSFVLNLRKVGDFTVNLTLEHDTKKDVSLSAAIQLVVTKLSFSKYIHTVSDGKTIKGADLMKNVLGGAGYTLKSIALKDDSFGTVSGTAPNLTITLKKAGSFNATLTLSKGGTSEDLAAEIEAVLPSLTFTKLVVGYKSTLSKAEIERQIQGNRSGYTISNISLDSSASAYATATAAGLDIKKVGSFGATITLTNPNYFEVSITNAQFQIDKNPAPRDLTFTTLQEAYTSGGSFTANEILGQVNGTKTGYTLKAIENLRPTGIAQIAADKKSLQFTKAGNFTATLILKHATKMDARIASAQFQIDKNPAAKDLIFTALKKDYTLDGGFTADEILGNIAGTKDGYTVKEIRSLDPVGIARTATDKKSLKFIKAGNFTATLVLKHPTKLDVEIGGAKFEINKIAYTGVISFVRLIQGFTTGGNNTITSVQLMKQILESVSAGFTLKSITPSDDSFATVSGTKPNLTLTLKKMGNFTAKLVLEHPTYADVIINNAEFTITLLNNKAEVASWKFGDKVATVSGTDINITLPFGNITAIDALKATVKISGGATISPDPTQSIDYTSPVDFKVTAGDKTTQQVYTVTVKLVKFMASWSGGWRDAKAYDATINHATGDITLDVNSADFDIDFKLADGATITPDPKTIDNWTSKVSFAVKIGSSQKDYGVKVTVNGRDIIKVTTANVKNTMTTEIGKHGDTADYNYIDVSGVTSMFDLFHNKYDFNGDITKWDVSGVRIMSSMFSGATKFNQPIGNWTVSKVEYMTYMFRSAIKFNQPIGNWTVSEVTNMAGMFKGADVFNKPIGNWTVSKVTNMQQMFNDALAFNQNISGWNTNSVTKCLQFSKGSGLSDENKPKNLPDDCKK